MARTTEPAAPTTVAVAPSAAARTVTGAQDEALDGADALVVMTEWRNFQAPDFADIAARLKQKVIFDGRNIYAATVLARYGLNIVAIGRSS